MQIMSEYALQEHIVKMIWQYNISFLFVFSFVG